MQVRKSGESYYSVVVRSTEGKDSYIQLEKVTNGTTEVLQGAKVNGLKTGTSYRLELEAAGKDKATPVRTGSMRPAPLLRSGR